jgi:hypothetical protein
VALLHWLPLLIVTAGLPLVASPLGRLHTADGQPWYSLRMAIFAAEAFALLVIAAAVAQRRWRLWAVPVGTALVMLTWNPVMNYGYRQYREGRSAMRPLAERILAAHGDAKAYGFRPERPARHTPIDLSIYLDRNVVSVADPAELRGTTGPRVYVVRQPHKVPLADPSPLAPPAGGPWRFFTALTVEGATWYAFTAE